MRKTFKKGFTLIELVIVIAIIAILAVGVIAALNPIEQNNRAQDGKYKNTLAETMGAIQRYNTAQSYMPFCISSASCTNQSAVSLWNTVDPNGSSVRSKLVDLGEMTANFTNAASTQLANIFVTFTSGSNNNQVALCYSPLSNAAKSDPLANYTSTGTAGTCPNIGKSTNTCYFCVVQ